VWAYLCLIRARDRMAARSRRPLPKAIMGTSFLHLGDRQQSLLPPLFDQLFEIVGVRVLR
jgi:hypothetical protein